MFTAFPLISDCNTDGLHILWNLQIVEAIVDRLTLLARRWQRSVSKDPKILGNLPPRFLHLLEAIVDLLAAVETFPSFFSPPTTNNAEEVIQRREAAAVAERSSVVYEYE